MKNVKLSFALLAIVVLLSACANGSAVETSDADNDNVAEEQELEKVTVALSAFQDVYSIHVGIEKGCFADEGIELEIVKSDWAGANDLLVGNQVDIATSSDSDIILQNSNGIDTTLAFPIFYFAGAALMYDADQHDWQTYDEFYDQVGDVKEAMRLTLEQAKGMKVGLNKSVSEFTSFISMLEYAGLDPQEYDIIDMSQEDLPPALMSGSIDIMISGIPQRLAVLNEGYATLIDQTVLPETISHNGFGAHREWIDNNPELAEGLLRAIFNTLNYIEENPDDAFPIIAERMKESGTVIEVDDLKSVWNVMEFFPGSKEFYEQEMLDPDGRFYWKDRFENVVNIMESEERIDEGVIQNLEDLHYTIKIVENMD